MSPQCVMTRKKASYNSGLNPIKGHTFCPGTQTRSRDNCQACLRVSQRPRHWAPCWLARQRPSLFCKSRLETPKTGSGPRNLRAVPPLASPSAISLSRIPACPGTQKRSTPCGIEISFKAFWHWWTKGDVVLTILRAFKATRLSEQILTYFSGLFWDCI